MKVSKRLTKYKFFIISIFIVFITILIIPNALFAQELGERVIFEKTITVLDAGLRNKKSKNIDIIDLETEVQQDDGEYSEIIEEETDILSVEMENLEILEGETENGIEEMEETSIAISELQEEFINEIVENIEINNSKIAMEQFFEIETDNSEPATDEENLEDQSSGYPNLKPYRHISWGSNNWDNTIVISTTTGSFKDSSTIYSDQNIYVDWAVINNGSSTINTKFYVYLYVNNVLMVKGYSTSLKVNWYAYWKDVNIGRLSGGNYTFKIVADATNTIRESYESDNSYSRSKSITSRGKPNLTPFRPDGWDDKIVISNKTGTQTNISTIYSDENVYIDWAIINNGSITIDKKYYTRLYLDNTLKGNWYTTSLKPNWYNYLKDFNIGRLAAGNYKIKIIADETNTISESSESDNQYYVYKSIKSRGKPNLTPFKPGGWSSQIVVSNKTGSTTDASNIYSNENVYVDWAVINNGSLSTGTKFYSKLYVDNTLKETWQTPSPLQPNYYSNVKDYNIGKLSAGKHSFKIVTDTSNAISESNESDNQYEKSYSVFQYQIPECKPSEVLLKCNNPSECDVTPDNITKKVGEYWQQIWGPIKNHSSCNVIDYRVKVKTCKKDGQTYQPLIGKFGDYFDISAGKDSKDIKFSNTFSEAGTYYLEFRFVSRDGTELSQGNLSPLYATVNIIGNKKSNLCPHNPSKWGSTTPIVISNIKNTYVDAPKIYSDESIYIDWAVINKGQIETQKTFYTKLFVDDKEKGSWKTTTPLNINYYVFIEDCNIGKLSSGIHKFKIVADYYNAIDEVNESDNTYEKSKSIEERKFPNLTPYKPDTWSDKIVVSNITNTEKDVKEQIYSDQNIFVDWAVINNGEAATDKIFYTKLYVNDKEKGSWKTNSINKNTYTYVKDANIGKLAPGKHIFKIVADTTDAILESNESDNLYSKYSLSIVERKYPNLTPYKPKGWDDEIIISNISNTNQDTVIYSNQDVFLDWAVINNGDALIDKRFYTKLYLDNNEKGTWQTDLLNTGYYAYKEDVNLGKITTGKHIFKIVTDTTNAIIESSESDNNFQKNKTIDDCIKPSANFSASPTSSDNIPQIINFIDKSTGKPTSWLWDFGDGSSSSSQNPSYNYTKPGKYTIKLTVSNSCGTDTETRIDYVMLKEPEYNLFISKTGTGTGVVNSDLSGISCGSDCIESYKKGTSVTISAKADSKSVFKYFSGGGCGNSDKCTIKMDSDITVSALFEGVPDIRVNPESLFFNNFQDNSLFKNNNRSKKTVRMLDSNDKIKSTNNKTGIECNISDINLKFGQKEGFDFIEIPEDEYDLHADKIGEPLLPAKLVYVLVSQGAELESIKYNILKKKELDEVYNIYPKQPETPISQENNEDFVSLNDDILSSYEVFPQSPVEFIESATVRGNTMFVFRIWPIQYIGKTGKIIINEHFQWYFNVKSDQNLTLQYNTNAPVIDEMIKQTVINPEKLEDIYAFSKTKDHTLESNNDYLIITNQELSDTFQNFADHKISLGLKAEVVTVEHIYKNYNGSDSQRKIKSCILDYAKNNGTKWVLLGGDDTVIPDRNCYGDVNYGKYTDKTIPTDLYYAGLDDLNWNDDDDDKWCEIPSEGDTIDMYPDVFVGRAPVRTVSEADAFIKKSINYITRPANDFAEKALLSGVQLWTSWDEKSDAHHKTEDMWLNDMKPYWSGKSYRLYDTGTDFGDEYDVTPINLQEQINNGYGVFFMATHGNQRVWGMESQGHFTSEHALNCRNKYKQGIIYTIACITNAFDSEHEDYLYDPALSEAFLRNEDGGAVIYIGSSRYGWGNGSQSVQTGTSYNYARKFFKHLFDESSLSSGQGDDPDPSDFPRRIGAVHASHKMYYTGYSSSYGSYRWIQFALNLMGDPHIEVHTREAKNTFTIYNEGKADLKVTSINKQNNTNWLSFSPIASQDSPLIIPKGESQVITVDVDWDKANTGVNEDKLIIYSNDTEKNPYPNGVNIKAEKECPLPKADFIVSSLSDSILVPINFIDKSIGNPIEWLWDFGDGETSTQRNPSHKYEKNGVYNVSLKVTNDCGSNIKEESGYITISYPTVKWLTEIQKIKENVGKVTIIATIDKISGRNVEIPYLVSGTATGNGVDHDLQNGQIIITAGESRCIINTNITNDSLDEQDEEIIITMGKVINASPGETIKHSITIIDDDSSPIVNDQKFSINENSIIGAEIGTIIASDADEGDVLSYSITSGNANETFIINTNSGLITVNSKDLNYEQIKEYALDVQVTDGLNLDTATINITINDINEPPIAYDGEIITKEGNSVEYGLKITDVDDGATFKYSIVNQGTIGKVTIVNNETGICKYTSDKSGTDIFTFKVNDGEFDSNVAKVKVTISPSQIFFKVSGNINYNGNETGMLIVDAFSPSDIDRYTPIGFGASSDWTKETQEAKYEISVPKGEFKIASFIDTNLSSDWDKGEPSGKYHKPVIVESNAYPISCNFILCLKGDTDGDLDITPQDAVDTFWLSFEDIFSPEQLCKCDYDDDFEITPQDAVDIFKASF